MHKKITLYINIVKDLNMKKYYYTYYCKGTYVILQISFSKML